MVFFISYGKMSQLSRPCSFELAIKVLSGTKFLRFQCYKKKKKRGGISGSVIEETHIYIMYKRLSVRFYRMHESYIAFKVIGYTFVNNESSSECHLSEWSFHNFLIVSCHNLYTRKITIPLFNISLSRCEKNNEKILITRKIITKQY